MYIIINKENYVIDFDSINVNNFQNGIKRKD